MKTIKWLKISIILQSIFAFFCITSTLCFIINRFTDTKIFFSIGNILMYGWILNPIGLISVIVGFILFFTEKGVNENRQLIGKKWIWFILFFVIDIILYLTAAIVTVVLTGGV